MPITPVLIQPNELIYCPWHKKWEVYIGEDPALCDWCCQYDPCPMHGANSDGLGYDPFWREEMEDGGMEDDARERLERIRAKRGSKERADHIAKIAREKEEGTRKQSSVADQEPLDAVDINDL